MLHQSRSSSVVDSASRRVLWALDGVPRRSALKLEAWLDSLTELTLADWARIGRRCGSRDDLAAFASRAVDHVVAAKGLGVAAWLIRDLVATATFHLQRETSHSSSRARSEFAKARAAAEWAGIGIAVESWLAPSDVATLMKPFAQQRL